MGLCSFLSVLEFGKQNLYPPAQPLESISDCFQENLSSAGLIYCKYHKGIIIYDDYLKL